MAEKLLIRLHDDEVTAAEIVTAAETEMAARREALGRMEPLFPQYGAAAVYPEPPIDVPVSMNLYYHLRLLNQQYNKLNTEAVLAESPATTAPVVGKLWKRIRAQAHELVLFYVNRLSGQQTEVNGQLVHTLNEMTKVIAEQQRQISALQDEVRRLTEE